MEEERCFNNWDLDAVKEKPVVPPLAKEPEPEPYAGWPFPDLGAGGGQDGDELLRALLAAQPPPPQPLPTPTPTPTLPPPPPPQQHRQPAVTAVDVPLPPSAPCSGEGAAEWAAGGRWGAKIQEKEEPGEEGGLPRSGGRLVVRRVGVAQVRPEAHQGLSLPKGYYRCSSSKGCAARKQVERSRADPNTFILTYTGEHNHAAPTHRNSLAGTTRHKFPSSAAPQPPPPSVVVGGAGAGDAQHQHQQPSPSPTSTSTAGLSPTTPLRTPSMEEDDDEEDELLVEDMEMAGEDELLFLNTDADAGAPMSSLFDIVDEPFLSSPWVTATSSAGEPATGAAAAGS
ncbi:unnamed protein product [Miscanthus lutarioriparius]|uniref:WRKY domain-containing protein n=1 Tax=Miscanthus lutarioriparius TaxID=422564 RepID=A0A811PZ46_9POAL|nr:unnamed protein product [Miscanthus lutarioriparius]